jgi:hypothetical protein
MDIFGRMVLAATNGYFAAGWFSLPQNIHY